MKHFKKHLALLMAGLLAASTLSACNHSSSDTGNIDRGSVSTGTNSKNGQTSGNANKYEGLTPSEVHDALLTASDYAAKLTFTNDGRTGTWTWEKDTNKYKLSCYAEGDEADNLLTYLDKTTNQTYTQDSDGTWSKDTTSVGDEYELTNWFRDGSEFEDYFFLFHDEFYKSYDAQNGYYPLADSDDYTGYYKTSGSSYTFYCNDLDYGIAFTLVIEFKPVTVTLPEVE